MKEDTKTLLSGGYCFLIKNSGPFVIGKDFEAPGPASRKIPRIKIDNKRWDELWSFVEQGAKSNADDGSERAIFEDATKRLDFENGVSEALSWYVSDMLFQANIPDFRKQLQKLSKTVKQFESQLPKEFMPLGQFLFHIYTGEAMLPDRLKPSQRKLMALQNAWRDRVGITAIKATLETMLRNIQAAQSLLGNKKPRQYQVRTFVLTLAKVWNKATGQWPKSARDPDRSKQSGPFANFVRETNNILPKRLRIPTLDRAIRAACECSNCP
ncbi:MAG: hypothetical protein ACLPXW_14255 [Xanthobacteraceae bacterium]